MVVTLEMANPEDSHLQEIVMRTNTMQQTFFRKRLVAAVSQKFPVFY
jgi:hypothetical protein